MEGRKCRYEIISIQIKQIKQMKQTRTRTMINDSDVEEIEHDSSGKLFAYNHFLYKNKPHIHL